jgi:hypothetical protein
VKEPELRSMFPLSSKVSRTVFQEEGLKKKRSCILPYSSVFDLGGKGTDKGKFVPLLI